MSLEISRHSRNSTSSDSTLRIGEPMSTHTPAEIKYQQQSEYFAEALDSGVYPIIDKDAAEVALADFREIRGNNHPKVAVFEAGVRDGHPVMTHIAITRLRQVLGELSGSHITRAHEPQLARAGAQKDVAAKGKLFPTKQVVFETVRSR